MERLRHLQVLLRKHSFADREHLLKAERWQSPHIELAISSPERVVGQPYQSEREPQGS